MDASQLIRMRAAAANIYVARQNPVDADMVTRNNRLKAAAQAFIAPYSQSNYMTATCCPAQRPGGPASDYGDSRLDEASFTGTAINTFTNVLDRRAGKAVCCGPPPASIPPQGIYLNATTPDAPYILLVSAYASGTLIVYFTPPANDNGSPIENYRYSLDGGQTFTYANTTASPLLITGLINGTTYSVILQAVNGFGPGAFSAPVSGTTPYETVGTAQWATYVAGNTSPIAGNVVNDIACDNNYNVYLCGSLAQFSIGMRTFDASGTGQTISPYTTKYVFFRPSAYLAKYSSDGKCQWITNADSTLGDGRSNIGVVVDTEQNLYVAGISLCNIDLYDASGISTIQSAYSFNQGKEAYVYKMDPNGKSQWVTGFASTVGVNMGFTIDRENNLYYGGYYNPPGSDRISLFDTSGTTQSNSLYSLPKTGGAGYSYLIKLNPNGKTMWGTYIMASGDDKYALVTDSGNNLYCGITYTGAVTLADASGYQQQNSAYTMPFVGGQHRAALIKYSSDGKVQWSTYLWNNVSFTQSRSVAVDSQNNIYWTGIYKNSMSVIDVSGTTQSQSQITLGEPTLNFTAVFLIKYNSSGKAQWATRIDSSGNDYALTVKCDTNDNVYVGGDTPGQLFFWNASGNTQTVSQVSVPSLGSPGGYVAKYNSNGICQWATYIDRTGTTESFASIGFDRSNSMYVGSPIIGTVSVQDVSGTTQKISPITISTTSYPNYPAIAAGAGIIKYR